MYKNSTNRKFIKIGTHIDRVVHILCTQLMSLAANSKLFNYLIILL